MNDNLRASLWVRGFFCMNPTMMQKQKHRNNEEYASRNR